MIQPSNDTQFQTSDPAMTRTPADQSMANAALSANLHRIVVVGGGGGGIELVTRLGDTLGRSGRADIALVERARTHLWKPLLHEVAAGSMDVSRHELDYLAQPTGIISGSAWAR
jgi:Pyridine nucleotide-disulphide oxidoreductase